MHLEPFAMERYQSNWENIVEFNLSESGVHPLKLDELLNGDELQDFARLNLGYNQTNGSEALRAAIACLYPGASSNHVLVTTGSAEGNFISTWCLLDRGDELAFMLPNYMQIWGAAQSFGALVKPFHLIPENGSWKIDKDEFIRAVSSATRLIAVCNPNNPTGAQLSAEEMDLICQTAAKVDAWILADEVYHGAERRDNPTPSFWGRYDKVIVIGGLSKAYGLPGLRIGWIIAPPDLIERLWTFHDYTTICPNPMSDYLACIALGSGMKEKILARTRKIVTSNFELMKDWMKLHGELFDCIPPAAGAIALAKYHLNIDSLTLVTQLRERKSVLVVPGSHFFMKKYLRFGFGSPSDYLRDALDRVSEFLDENGD